jgi:hypothetical protein
VASSTERAVPAIARIAGLPTSILDRFATSLVPVLEAAAGQATLVHAARAALADSIHDLVPGASPELRRFLLAVRRDCHNGRPLARHAAAPLWGELCRAVGPLAARAAALDAEAAARRREYEEAYAAAREAERGALAEALRDPAFLRGLALASPDLYRAALALNAAGGAPAGKSARKAEANLVRYVTRAAAKLSPFSTFTRLALADLRGDLPAGPPRLHPGEWNTRSLVRVKPYLLEKCGELLRQHPPFRDGLRVVLNNSVTELEPGRFLFLRPSHWRFDEQAGRFSYFSESLVRVGLSGALITWLRETLAASRPTCGELAALAAARFPEAADEVQGQLQALLRIGFLVTLFPWRSQEGYTEAGMLRALDALPADPATAPLRDRLAELVNVQRGFATAADPLGAVTTMDGLIDGLWEAAAALGGVDPASSYERASRYSIYEDVFMAPASDPAGAVVQVPLAAAAHAVRSMEPLVRLTSVFDHRHDFLAALAGFARDRWPGARQVKLMELFHHVQPLWQKYLRFRVEAREDGGWRRTWNPRGIPALDALARHRVELWDGLPEFLSRHGGIQHLSGEGLLRRLDQVPRAYTSASGGACLFLQQADAQGSMWMLNRMKEGTGRFGSRFTPVMDAPARRRYARHLASRGTMAVDGGRAQLMDLRCVQGDTLNVHALQTPRVLTLPGAEGEAPPARQVPLGDLWVRLGPGRPHLRDGRGRRLWAVQLGFAFEDYLPTLIKFLCLFGPSEMRAVFPMQWVERSGGLVTSRRTHLGNVVLHRATWATPTGDLAAATAGQPAPEAFAAIQRWRAAHGVPERVFLIERVPHPRMGERAQPQYIDFTSPALAEVFRSAVEDSPEVSVVEALPTPDLFPRDGAGRRWAVEVVVDSLALRERPAPRRVRPAHGFADPPALVGVPA